VTILPVAL